MCNKSCALCKTHATERRSIVDSWVCAECHARIKDNPALAVGILATSATPAPARGRGRPPGRPNNPKIAGDIWGGIFTAMSGGSENG